jgi:hypothetical protein
MELPLGIDRPSHFKRAQNPSHLFAPQHKDSQL